MRLYNDTLKDVPEDRITVPVIINAMTKQVTRLSVKGYRGNDRYLLKILVCFDLQVLGFKSEWVFSS